MKAISNPRLFIAINPPLAVRELLFKWQSRLHVSGLLVKWVEKQNLHLTLEFLGDTEWEKVEGLKEVLSKAAGQSSAFSLAVKGMGTFPNLKQPRVIWMGLTGQLEELTHLQRNVRQGLTEQGYYFDKKPFRPHLTLGRVRDAAPAFDRQLLQEVFTSAGAIDSPEWRVERIDLMQSELGRPGPRYTVLESFPLRT
ncbi:MAG: RNA 2',3'-cyclic phosphodiesterase [Firmicutes bacterium]|nr:RNA 2',3'-cyclic phosphodiesterase [Bacillota bacterium]